MDQAALQTLGYEEMVQELMRFAVSYEGRRRIAELVPEEKLAVAERKLAETAEANAIIAKGASVPLPSLEGIELVISLLGSGYLFGEQDFAAVAQFLRSCSQLRKYMAGKMELAPLVASYALSLCEEQRLQDEINRCIRHGRIEDSASKELEKIRRKMNTLKERIHKRMQTVLSKYSSLLQEQLISTRDGRYVIPVKKEYYRQVKGTVLDQSTSGQTVFVEPEEISSLQFELNVLLGDEAREEAKILAMLSSMLEASAAELKQNIEITGTYDFIFAKGKYGASIGGRAVPLNAGGEIRLVGAKHPKLLQTMVPLDISLGGKTKGMIITGPNTGGKTVVLRTIGLLTLMAQSGLLIPAEDGSRVAVFQNIRAVIGDGQSLEQSLSTFSAQISSLSQMLETADGSSLMLIDELAAGTDPAEGMALSIAILEELGRKGAMVAVTTHFNGLKEFAAQTPGFCNARMEFDPVSLKPLYRLTIGEAGQSYALEIARRLGMDGGVIERSRQLIHHTAGRQASRQDEAKAAIPVMPVMPVMSESQEELLAEEPESPPEPEPAGQEEMSVNQRPAYEIGDAVWITSLNRMGIVCAPEDSRGMLGVQVQKQKLKINHKRLKPYISRSELYPGEDYDLDIVFESKENRKLSKQFGKRHVEGRAIIKDGE
ncbi:DNA mismatch repair protein MutS [Paenibacillus yonginensis]|uniref:DNA mismatch repair protein MutS n=1 Tax=Paenibacillus yonginensis TaxID=1462996 RepID=A0A1B1N666_9BACL|nr:DNA mismatch repair protein MutS [Paenibacillus yonginensis]ANS76902.1 DNA mismatch repair protein MutS [Paenibacillus yonginensis]